MEQLNLNKDDLALVTAALFEFYYNRMDTIADKPSEMALSALELAKKIVTSDWPT